MLNNVNNVTFAIIYIYIYIYIDRLYMIIHIGSHWYVDMPRVLNMAALGTGLWGRFVFFVTSWGHLHHHLSTTRAAIDWTPEMSESGAATGCRAPQGPCFELGTIGTYGCVWKCCVPHCTQWFCWSLSLWKMAISLGILTQHFQTNPYWNPGTWLPCFDFFTESLVFFPGLFQEGHDSRVQQIDQAGHGRTLGCFAGKDGVFRCTKRCLANGLFVVQCAQVHDQACRWIPATCWLEAFQAHEKDHYSNRSSCADYVQIVQINYRFEGCVDAQTKLKPGRVPAFSWDFCCFSPLTLLLGAQLRKSSLRLDVQINESWSVLVLLVLPLNPVTSGICHHPPISAILFRHLSWVSSLVLVVWTTKGFRTLLPSLPPEANPACLGRGHDGLQDFHPWSRHR